MSACHWIQYLVPVQGSKYFKYRFKIHSCQFWLRHKWLHLTQVFGQIPVHHFQQFSTPQIQTGSHKSTKRQHVHNPYPKYALDDPDSLRLRRFGVLVPSGSAPWQKGNKLFDMWVFRQLQNRARYQHIVKRVCSKEPGIQCTIPQILPKLVQRGTTFRRKEPFLKQNPKSPEQCSLTETKMPFLLQKALIAP